MTDDAFLQTIADCPSEEAAGKYGDWLQEQGRCTPAEVMRLVQRFPDMDWPRHLYAYALNAEGRPDLADLVRTSLALHAAVVAHPVPPMKNGCSGMRFPDAEAARLHSETCPWCLWTIDRDTKIVPLKAKLRGLEKSKVFYRYLGYLLRRNDAGYTGLACVKNGWQGFRLDRGMPRISMRLSDWVGNYGCREAGPLLCDRLPLTPSCIAFTDVFPAPPGYSFFASFSMQEPDGWGGEPGSLPLPIYRYLESAASPTNRDRQGRFRVVGMHSYASYLEAGRAVSKAAIKWATLKLADLKTRLSFDASLPRRWRASYCRGTSPVI